MIKKLINKLFSQKISEEDIECTIDEDPVDCIHFDDDQDKAYVGAPAPILNPVDEWFASPYGYAEPVMTEKQIEYQEKLDMEKEVEDSQSKEPENIHQLMYEMATKNQSTTLHLDPPGGSENFHEGTGGWNSGTGMGQFQ
tara:strand:- start:116 stop:535 length:420 start_codon:yes stop_codon:yes gene_type:complete